MNRRLLLCLPAMLAAIFAARRTGRSLAAELAATPAAGATPATLPPGTAELGATLRISGLAVTVWSAEQMGSYGYTYAAEGATLLVIEVEVVNESGVPRAAGAAAFSAVDLAARAAWPAIKPVAIGLLEDAELAPGEAVSGRVVIEVPAGAAALLARFDSGPFVPAAGYWRVPDGPPEASPSPAASPPTSQGSNASPRRAIPL